MPSWLYLARRDDNCQADPSTKGLPPIASNHVISPDNSTAHRPKEGSTNVFFLLQVPRSTLLFCYFFEGRGQHRFSSWIL